MKDDQGKPAEAKRVMDDALRRMLATPPEPHVKPKKRVKARAKK